jgi:hypothetical protein
MNDQPFLITTAVVLGAVALVVAVSAVLYRSSARVGWITGMALGGWLVVTAVLAGAGLYSDERWLGLALVVPVVLGVLALRLPAVAVSLRSERVVALLAAVQVLRLVGGVFLVLLALDRLPTGFALPAGGGDVLVGLLAPVVAYALGHRPDRRALGIAFNVLGLLDFAAAIPLGVLHAPGQLQVFVTEPTSETMGLLPMALIPTFVVPLAIVLHIASIRLLTAPTARTQSPARRSAPSLPSS